MLNSSDSLGLKGVLNPNFRPISFELKKKKYFKINFNLDLRVM